MLAALHRSRSAWNVTANRSPTPAIRNGWTRLYRRARKADLFIAEAYFWERKVKYHLDWVTLKSHLGEIRAKNTADGVTREQRDVLSESRMREICMSGSMPSDPDAYERGYAWPLHRGQRWGRP